jgi:hypothetical protein
LKKGEKKYNEEKVFSRNGTGTSSYPHAQKKIARHRSYALHKN